METIGILAGGIANSFGSMINGIAENIFMLREKTEIFPDVLVNLEEMEEEISRATETIDQLLVFARKGGARMESFDLAPFFDENLKLHCALLPENISLRREFCKEPLLIHGDVMLLSQLVRQLLNNARDAVAERDDPEIIIRLQPLQPDDAFLQRHLLPVNAGRFAHLSLTDNGCGIPEALVGRIFEPFFTTKDAGKGSGIGLAAVPGAVHAHGGAIEVESVAGKGSTFRVFLPLTDAKRCQKGAA